MSLLALLLSVAAKFVVSLAAILVLDFAFKIQVQFAWSIAMRKRLPIGYGPLTPMKATLILGASAAGTLVLLNGGRTLNVWMDLLILSLLLIAVHGMVVYWRQMRDE